jgi:hypothetical protein
MVALSVSEKLDIWPTPSEMLLRVPGRGGEGGRPDRRGQAVAHAAAGGYRTDHDIGRQDASVPDRGRLATRSWRIRPICARFAPPARQIHLFG